MDTSVPRSWKHRTTLNGNVRWVGTDHGKMGVSNEGMTIVNMVDSSKMLVTGSFMDGVIGDILFGEQELIGLQNNRVHG